MLKLNYLLVAILLLTLSCKKTKDTPKEEQPVVTANPQVIPPPKKIDTIKPLPYIPAYPGSYWIYSDGSKIVTSDTYQKDTYTVRSLDYTFKSDTFYVPIYNHTPLWGYRAHQEGQIATYADPTQPLVRIISDSLPVGSSWLTSYISHYAKWSTIIAKDSNVIISGKNYFPTIVLSHFENYNSGPRFITGRSYYTKEIGLIKYERLAATTSSFTSEKTLVDYFINK